VIDGWRDSEWRCSWSPALPILALAAGARVVAGRPPREPRRRLRDFSDSVGGNDRVAFKREIEKQILPWLQPGDSSSCPDPRQDPDRVRPLVEADLRASAVQRG